MMKLYVGGLPYQVTEEDVRQMFTEYGDVTSVRIITDRETGRSKGFGFVEMESDNARTAIQELHQAELEGRTLTVNEARPAVERGNGYGNSGGNRSYGKSIDGRRW